MDDYVVTVEEADKVADVGIDFGSKLIEPVLQ